MSPIYEYYCEGCGGQEELKRRVDERDDQVLCSYCGELSRRKISHSSFQLKGGGWESDGYSSRLGDTDRFKVGQAEEASGKAIKRK